MVTAAMKLKDASWKKCYDQPRQHIKKQRHYFADKGPSSQSLVFPVVMYGFESWDYKESWVPNNWFFWNVVLEKTLESPLDCKEIKESVLKEISPDSSLEGLMLKLKLQYFGHLIWRMDLIGKDPDVGKDWRQEEKQMTEDDMVGWHHHLKGHEFE